MKRRALHGILLVVAAGVCHVVLRYRFGDFQGYFTVAVRGIAYGIAHVKSSTVWVSGTELTPIPGFGVMVIASLAWLAYEVRVVYREFVHRNEKV
jgi:hypothetical protein